MRQTQINGETFVSANDVADWIVKDTDSVRDHPQAGVVIAVLEEMAKEMRLWANDPARKRGVPNLTLEVK